MLAHHQAYTVHREPSEQQVLMIPDPFQTAFWEILLELAVIWAGVYLVFRFLQGTRGAGVIRGLGILGVILMIAWLVLVNTDSFDRLRLILNYFVGLLAVLLIVIFQPELRQAAIRIGQTKILRAAQGEQEATVDAIAEAVEFATDSPGPDPATVADHIFSE